MSYRLSLHDARSCMDLAEAAQDHYPENTYIHALACTHAILYGIYYMQLANLHDTVSSSATD